MELQIDYNKIASIVTSVRNTVNNSNVISEYDTLIAGFTESKGSQADAMRDLFGAEKVLASQLNTTVSKLVNKIQISANEFENIDKTMANSIVQSSVMMQ